MKKRFTAVAVYMILTFVAVAVFACGDSDKSEIRAGVDEYGRNFGEIYALDSEQTGVFRVPYEISDTSSVGKAMISKYCAEYAEVEKRADVYVMTYFCEGKSLGSVGIKTDDGIVQGTEIKQSGYTGYSFELTEDAVCEKIPLVCVEKLMNRTVEFSITLDTASAVLAG